MRLLILALSLIPAIAWAAEKLPYGADMGPNPVLEAPSKSPIPTVNAAKAVGWPDNATLPEAAPGFTVNAFARGLEHPRWIYALPNGDILVAETNAPPKPEDAKGIKGFIMKQTMKWAGAGSKSPNRVTLLRDADKDGTAEFRNILIEDLNSPFGMALIGDTLYIANTDAVVKLPYTTGETKITASPIKVADLPGGPINHHWTKSLVASPDGRYLYVGVGSNSNAAENGIDKEENRAAVLQIDLTDNSTRIFASGLRNPVGLAFQPLSGKLWVSVNERDELGDNLVPDYMTSLKDGGFYGWPYSYYGSHIDERVKPQRPSMVAKAIKPDYALGAHTASLGLMFYTGDLFPIRYKNGAFIGQHGSWNRGERSGYKIIFVPFENGIPTSNIPEDFVTGFLNDNGEAMGRPVGLTMTSDGALLSADDVGNVIWRVTPSDH